MRNAADPGPKLHAAAANKAKNCRALRIRCSTKADQASALKGQPFKVRNGLLFQELKNSSIFAESV